MSASIRGFQDVGVSKSGHVFFFVDLIFWCSFQMPREGEFEDRTRTYTSCDAPQFVGPFRVLSNLTQLNPVGNCFQSLWGPLATTLLCLWVKQQPPVVIN